MWPKPGIIDTNLSRYPDFVTKVTATFVNRSVALSNLFVVDLHKITSSLHISTHPCNTFKTLNYLDHIGV